MLRALALLAHLHSEMNFFQKVNCPAAGKRSPSGGRAGRGKNDLILIPALRRRNFYGVLSMEENVRENKMGTMPIGKLLANMAGPVMVSMLFQALYNIVDSVFVARLSQDAMNAVSLAFPLQMLCIAFSVGTGVGMNALLARSLGEKNQTAVNHAAGTGLFLTLCTAAVFMLLGFSLATPFFRFQTANEQIIAYGQAYVRICIGCSLGIFVQVYGERLLQATGRTSLSMISQIVGAVCNIVLDPILIFGLLGFPRMEVAGAAVATITGQFIGGALGLVLNHTKNPDVQLRLSGIRPHRATVADIYAVGIPSIIMQSIGSVMMFGMNKILISFTEAATAVFGAYFKLQSFIFMPCFGLNNAMVPIVSFNYGAQKFDRVRRAVRLTSYAAIGIMCVGFALLEFIPETLLGLFSPTEEMLSIGRAALRIIGIHFPLAGFSIIAGSACQALGKPTYALVSSVCRQIVVLLPAAYLLSLTGRLELVWLSFPIAEIVSVIMNAAFLKRTYRASLGE